MLRPEDGSLDVIRLLGEAVPFQSPVPRNRASSRFSEIQFAMGVSWKFNRLASDQKF